MKLCVVCQKETVERPHESVTADVCPDGHGLWLLEAELLRAVRTVAGELPVGSSYAAGRSLRLAADRDIDLGDEVRDCPMCHEPMGSVEYEFTSGVTVDVCAHHGVWLDAGELEKLEAAAERRSDPNSPQGRVNASRIDAVRNAEPTMISQRLPLLDVLRAFFGR